MPKPVIVPMTQVPRFRARPQETQEEVQQEEEFQEEEYAGEEQYCECDAQEQCQEEGTQLRARPLIAPMPVPMTHGKMLPPHHKPPVKFVPVPVPAVPRVVPRVPVKRGPVMPVHNTFQPTVFRARPRAFVQPVPVPVPMFTPMTGTYRPHLMRGPMKPPMHHHHPPGVVMAPVVGPRFRARKTENCEEQCEQGEQGEQVEQVEQTNNCEETCENECTKTNVCTKCGKEF
jgi:hypothetical protein